MRNKEKIIEVLMGAKALIEKGWCQNRSSENKDGMWAHPRDKKACRWCASAALSTALINVDPDYQLVFWNKICTHFTSSNKITGLISHWNDAPSRKKEDILAALNKSIAALETAKNSVPI